MRPTHAVIAAAAWLGIAIGANLAWAQADPDKLLRVAFPAAETGFDPQAAGDEYSNSVNRVIFDTLYKYDYLARPYKLVPNTAVGMPEFSADGRTWRIRLRPGIFFADDPVFKGQRRELTAADYVYAMKRVLDPRIRSNSLQALDGRFVGAEAIVARAKETGRFDYDAPMEGLQAIDRYTIQFRLNFSDYELLANLTTVATAGIAREAIEAYADGAGWVMANPVGTGPYRPRTGAGASGSCCRRIRTSATSSIPRAATPMIAPTPSCAAGSCRWCGASRSASSRNRIRGFLPSSRVISTS